MDNLYDYLRALPPDMKLSQLPARVLAGGVPSSLEATIPVAQAPERKRMWGAASPVDTRRLAYTRQTATPEESQMAWQQMKQDARQDIPQFAKGAAMGITTDVLGAPVDIATTVLRPFGYDVPPEKVIGGSDWIADKLGVQPSGSGAETAGRLVGGLIDPATAAKAGSVALGKGMPLLAGITTYHGSPTSGIRQWDLGFRGTGEGRLAQGSETFKDMIGHGLYSAERESIAKGYQERLARSHPDLKTLRPQADEIRNLLNTIKQDKSGAWVKEIPILTEKLNALDAEIAAKTGSLYETELLAHPDEFLLWDKPLSEQPKQVQEALMELFREWSPDNFAGKTLSDRLKYHFGDGIKRGTDIYDILSRNLGSDKAASDYLASKGIAGIKYLDNPSRGAGEGTYNYVTFKPESEAIITHENQKRISGAVEEAYRRMRDPKGKALLEQRYPELKGLK